MNSPTREEVRERRKAAGLTQKRSAELIRGALRTWQDYEAGARSMHPGLWELYTIKTAGIIGARRAQAAAESLNRSESQQAPQPCDQPVD